MTEFIKPGRAFYGTGLIDPDVQPFQLPSPG